MTTRRTYRVNADPITELVDILVGTPDEFNTDKDKLRGRAETGAIGSRLNGLEYDTFMSHRAQNRITYVIYSYTTPIAWLSHDRANPVPTDPKMWYVVLSYGSNTTAKHINKVLAALDRINTLVVEI